MQPPTPKSLVLDLLSTLRGGSMPVAALVAAGALFDLRENGVRVAVARLTAAGLLERDQRGHYRLGAAAGPIARRVGAWRRLEDRTRRWDGSWAAVHPGAHGRGRSAARRALRLLGFRALDPALALRPNNLRGGVAALRGELASLGLDTGALVFRLDELDSGARARASALFDPAGLARGYARSLAALTASEARLARLAPERAMVESFDLGGQVIRQLVLDPLLPPPLVDAAARRALLDALRRYDRAGRRAWSGFLARYGTPDAGTPANTRMGAGAHALAFHG